MQRPDDQQRQLLASLSRNQQRLRLLGGGLTFAGLGYLVFAFSSFDPSRAAVDAASFDALLTRPILAHYAATERLLERLGPETFIEESLSTWLLAQARASGALLVLVFRGLLGMFSVLLGFAILTVTVERARLLRLMDELPPSPEDGGSG